MRKGDVIYLPKGIPHAPRVTGNDEAVVVVVCVPGGFDLFLGPGRNVIGGSITLCMALTGQWRYALMTDRLSAAMQIAKRIHALAQDHTSGKDGNKLAKSGIVALGKRR